MTALQRLGIFGNIGGHNGSRRDVGLQARGNAEVAHGTGPPASATTTTAATRNSSLTGLASHARSGSSSHRRRTSASAGTSPVVIGLIDPGLMRHRSPLPCTACASAVAYGADGDAVAVESRAQGDVSDGPSGNSSGDALAWSGCSHTAGYFGPNPTGTATSAWWFPDNGGTSARTRVFGGIPCHTAKLRTMLLAARNDLCTQDRLNIPESAAPLIHAATSPQC